MTYGTIERRLVQVAHAWVVNLAVYRRSSSGYDQQFRSSERDWIAGQMWSVEIDSVANRGAGREPPRPQQSGSNHVNQGFEAAEAAIPMLASVRGMKERR